MIFQVLKIDCWSPYDRLTQTHLKNNCKDEFTRRAAMSKMFIMHKTEMGEEQQITNGAIDAN